MHSPGPVFTRPKIYPPSNPRVFPTILVIFYSLDWSQVAFGAFSFLFLFDYFGDSWNIYPHFLFCTRSVYGRTRNDQKAGKVRKTIRLQRHQALWQTEDYFLNEKFYLKTLNPKETQWKHLLYISSRFFIDESSWNPCSLRANVSVLLRSGLYFRRHIYLITDGSIVTSSITLYK